jgi:hypothetical protein
MLMFLYKILNTFCDAYIKFLHAFYKEGKLPFKSMGVLYLFYILKLNYLLGLFLFVYFLGFFIFLFGISNKFIGDAVASFLKKNASEAVFPLIGNGFGSGIFLASFLKTPAINKVFVLGGKTMIATVPFIATEHIITETFHPQQFIGHAMGDLYNGAHTPLKIDPKESQSILSRLLTKW